jgi:hypothetical protein
VNRAGPALLLLWLVLSGGQARAFVRSHVEGEPTLYLYWNNRSVAVFLQQRGSEDVQPGAMRAAVLRSLTEWSANACTDLYLHFGGTTTSTATNLTSAEPDMVNSLVWREAGEWPEDIGPGTLALTTLVYDRGLGQILDGDVDFNGQDFFWTARENPADSDTDVQNTVTHELGHLIGLDHSDDPDSTMFGGTEPAEFSKRDLGADDLDALCYVYQADEDTPLDTVTSEPAPLELEGAGCAAGGGRPIGGATGALLVVAALVIARRRRRG